MKALMLVMVGLLTTVNAIDTDECGNTCHSSATCKNTDGSYNCSCNPGFHGNGTYCSDIDECLNSTWNDCHVKATCLNTEGSFNCSCGNGFYGNGTFCQDTDECADLTHNCHSSATCYNTDGSYNCSCNPGFDGNGTYCSEICASGWRYYEDSCYLLSTSLQGAYSRQGHESITWEQARVTCQALQGDLAIVPTAAEQEWIAKQATVDLDLWVGANNIQVWIDGTNMTENSVTPYRTGQCIVIGTGGLKGMDCNDKTIYMCERPTDPSPYRTLGCWADPDGLAIPSLQDHDIIGDHSAVDKCYQAAQRNAYRVFGLQDGGLCSSSDVAHLTYQTYGRSADCGLDGEGGVGAKHVYKDIGGSSADCDFDINICQYTQVTTDAMDWQHISGPTVSASTGPSADSTTGFGSYIYIEASDTVENDVARLECEVIPDGAHVKSCLSWHYHMYGSGTGTLRVLVKQGMEREVWHQSGDQGNQWYTMAVTLRTAAPLQIVFEGTRGSSDLGDIALDDVALTAGACKDCQEVPTQLEFCKTVNGYSRIYLPNVYGHSTMDEVLASDEYKVTLSLSNDRNATCHPSGLAFACFLLAPMCIDVGSTQPVTRKMCWSWCREIVDTNQDCPKMDTKAKAMFLDRHCDGLPNMDCFHSERTLSKEATRGYSQFQGVWYKVFEERKSYTDSLQMCREDGGTLSMPKTAAINAFLINFITDTAAEPDGAYRFGLSEPPDESGAWMWADGAILGVYSSWIVSDAGIKGCASYVNATKVNTVAQPRWSATWSASPCHTLASFICQVEMTDCFYGHGHDYSGTWEITERGERCVSWQTVKDEVPLLSESVHDITNGDPMTEYNLEENYCRLLTSPRAEVFSATEKPLCFVRNTTDQLQPQYCSLPRCNMMTGTTCEMNITGLKGRFSNEERSDMRLGRCQWNVEVSEGYHVELHFHPFELSIGESGFCQGGRVHVIDGSWSDGKSDIVGTYCGHDMPDIVSRSRRLTVVFYGSMRNSSDTFVADYTARTKAGPTECNADGSHFVCDNGHTCIPFDQLCHGDAHCWDGKDAEVCSCQTIHNSIKELCPTSAYATFPNHYRHVNFDAILQWEKFNTTKTLSQKRCHDQIREFLCYMVVSPCSGSKYAPCRSWCEELKLNCDHEPEWSAVVPECSAFDASNHCYPGPISQEDPRTKLLVDKFEKGSISPNLPPPGGNGLNITVAASIDDIIDLDEPGESITTAARINLCD
ncbi:uncharacterized protein LOC118413606 [Branchiostoma floridae]|uniref:Uncharacterized protein LOC118413606 n=1 Tax=Branchiostoma floridae TaxID=7739 RepID=A0A9J7MMW9_BRAFL|nr:uncharacterized protein LOC118413606 [Branchiostoma floridae]